MADMKHLFVLMGLFGVVCLCPTALAQKAAQVKIQSLTFSHPMEDRVRTGNTAYAWDGKMETMALTRNYESSPGWVTADLGKATGIGEIRLFGGATSHERKLRRKIEVHASSDGKKWRYLMDSKSAAYSTKPFKRYQFRFSPVKARYVRIKYSTKFRFAARELQVFSAKAQAEAFGKLKPVLDADYLVCLIQDWPNAGARVTPSESLTVRLWNSSPNAVAITSELTYSFIDSRGQSHKGGKASLKLAGGKKKSVIIPQPANLPSGRLNISYTLTTADGGRKAGRFDYLIRRINTKAPEYLRVVQWLDCMDPEGYGDMLCGEAFSPFIENMVQFPKQGQPDVVVIKQSPIADKIHPPVPTTSTRAKLLRSYLRAGGKVLIIGPAPKAYDDLAPLTVAGNDTMSKQSERMRILTTKHPIFAQWGRGVTLSRRHWLAKTKGTTKTLAKWSDGTPALAERKVGKGTVIQMTCAVGKELSRQPTPSGSDELYLRCLYALAGKADVDVTAALAKSARNRYPVPAWSYLGGAREGASRKNFGGFGWTKSEGLLADVFSEGMAVRAIGFGKLNYRLTPENKKPLRRSPVVTEINWTRKILDYGRYTVTLHEAAPGILYDFSDAKAANLSLSAQYVAFMQGGKLVAKAMPSTGIVYDPKDGALSENWIAFWGVGADGTVKGPVELVMTRKPSQVTASDKGVRLTFPDKAGKMVVLRPLGIEAPSTKSETAWKGGLPERAAKRCRFWAAASLALPKIIHEAYRVRDGRVEIENYTEFDTLKNDWKIKPLPIAMLPPMLRLAQNAGMPVQMPERTSNLRYPTKAGPLYGVIGMDRATYTLPIPNQDHQGMVADLSQKEWQDRLEKFVRLGLPYRSATAFSGDTYLDDLQWLIYPKATSTESFIRRYFPITHVGFPTIMSGPASNEATRKLIKESAYAMFRKALDLHQEKLVLAFRYEPFSQLAYPCLGVYPVAFRGGVRMYQDENEFAGILAYQIFAYAQYSGDWDIVRDNWGFIVNSVPQILRAHNYWSFMCSSAGEDGSAIGSDMLNAEYHGWVALAKMATATGDDATRDYALYQSARSAAPTLARLAMDDYLKADAGKLNPKFDKPGCTMKFHEASLYRIPETSKQFFYHILLYDTASGTGPEMLLLYKQYPKTRAGLIAQEKRAGKVVMDGKKKPYIVNAYAWLMIGMGSPMRGDIGEDIIAIMKIQMASKYRTLWGWRALVQSNAITRYAARNVPIFAIDWTPFAYESGEYHPSRRIAKLVFTSPRPERLQLRFATKVKIQEIKVNGVTLKAASYRTGTDGATTLNVPPQSRIVVEITFSKTAAATLHEYFKP
jgi:F5/8 type C domain